MGIEAKGEDFDDLARDLKQITKRMRPVSLERVTKPAAQEFRQVQTKAVFGAEQSWEGEKWQPLSQATINNRRGKHTKVYSSASGGGGSSTKRASNKKTSGTKGKKRKRKSKTAKPFTGKMLRDTGNLFRGNSATGTKDSIVFGVSGSAAAYAGTHQFGRKQMSNRKLPFGGAAIPARPFLPVDSAGNPAFKSGPGKSFETKLRNRMANWVLYGIQSSDPRVRR